MRKFLLISLLLCVSFWVKGQKTLIYFEQDTVQVSMDLYYPQLPYSGKIPLVIFVHGGGFSSGDRSAGAEFCNYAASQGYAAASISYTLYMKGKSFGCDGILSEKVKAIRIAVAQLWQATSYFTHNSEYLGIDTNQIFVAGNSAGAETLLHATFWNRQKMNLYPGGLSQSFKYAGLLSGSGAIMDLNLIQKSNMVPILLSHGNCDPMVPYGTAAHRFCSPDAPGWLMLFGSAPIYDWVSKLGGTVSLLSFCNGGHELSDILFTEKKKLSVDFMNRVIAGEKFSEHNEIQLNQDCDTKQQSLFCN
ncbi:MAG: alpha/beta hydrolase [Bacteroidales bacterium]|nr:alpha/beta hydrolase [Bacteroidales bacterium]